LEGKASRRSKKDYVPFEESNLKFNNSMSIKVPPEMKLAQKKHITERFYDLKDMCFCYIIFRIHLTNGELATV